MSNDAPGWSPEEFAGHWSPDDFTLALASVDDVKDHYSHDVPPNELMQSARRIVATFGMLPSMVMSFASAYTRDAASTIQEHGGDETDVRRTVMIDGICIGLALALFADEGIVEDVRFKVGQLRKQDPQ